MNAEDVKLKLDLDDMLSRSEFEWQEWIVESPIQAAEAISILLDYVRTMEGLE